MLDIWVKINQSSKCSICFKCSLLFWGKNLLFIIYKCFKTKCSGKYLDL